MAAFVHTSRLQMALRHLPAPLLAALDAWSVRRARERLEKRREALRKPEVEAPVPYRPKPWRD
ncbi:hypothetical protein [Caenimonas aquaedulcis]|uniref:Uncharacterized protein n=1 Tax=Caenimonas aquaedulcis TaxID=2793270 RepID=A0A931H636_9BURK|nr:hypothetical protein [Caenimonas aquaedulcis]MBG9389123.1 hypothetical protein [Caenimonas aquaedulcis]